MTTEKELMKEIERLDNFATENMQTHNCMFDEGLVGYKERYYNLKAELKGIQSQKQKIIEEIEKRQIKARKRIDFCKKHSKKSGDYNDNETFRALSVLDELTDILKFIEGGKLK